MEAYYKEVVTSFFLGGGILAGSWLRAVREPWLQVSEYVCRG
jgi:hypothetical protein